MTSRRFRSVGGGLAGSLGNCLRIDPPIGLMPTTPMRPARAKPVDRKSSPRRSTFLVNRATQAARIHEVARRVGIRRPSVSSTNFRTRERSTALGGLVADISRRVEAAPSHRPEDPLEKCRRMDRFRGRTAECRPADSADSPATARTDEANRSHLRGRGRIRDCI